MTIIIVLYLLGCAVCGFMGRNTAWGFLGHFFLAAVITPIGGFFVQLAGRPSREMRERLARAARRERKPR
jgi:hypothetical protein